MSDSYIPYAGLAQPASPPANVVTAFQHGQEFGLEYGRQRAALNALQGVDITNPDSVNRAANALVGLNMADSAKATVDVAYQRAINQAQLPVVQNAFGLANRAIDQSSNQPQQNASPAAQGAPQTGSDIPPYHADPNVNRIAQDGLSAAQDIQRTQDPVLRQSLADAYRTKLIADGMTPETADGFFGPAGNGGEALSDANLSKGAARLQQYLAQAPQIGQPTTPGYGQAASTLAGPLANPIVEAALGKAGLDVGPGIDQALALTGPYRSAEAGAPYQPVTVEGPQGQPVSMSAANFAAGQRAPNAGPIVGATPGAKAAQTAAAGAPYTPVTVPTGVPGQTQTISAAQFAAGRGAPEEGGQVQGPANAPPITSATAAAGAGAVGGANVSVDHAQKFEDDTGAWKIQKGTIDNLRQAASQIATGPHAPFWGFLGQLAAEYGYKGPLTPTTDQTAAFEEVRKLAQQVAGQQAHALGLPNTNMTTEISGAVTPNEKNSPLGIQKLLGVIEGNWDYLGAMRNAWEEYKGTGKGYETFEQFRNAWNQHFDPRIWQGQYMPDADRVALRKQIPTYDAQVNFLARKGYLAPQ